MEKNIQKKMEGERRKEMEGKTYADVMKRSKEEVIVVEPKDKTQDCNITRKEYKSRIRPEIMRVGINKMVNTRQGGVLIACSSKSDIEKVAVEARNKLGEKYRIRTPEVYSPKVRIYNIEDDLDNEELKKCLLVQNEDVFQEDSGLQIMVNKRMVTGEREGNRRFNMVIVSVKPEEFIKVMQKGRLNVGWQRCKVEEYLGVKRCFNCYSYDHKRGECGKKTACARCGEAHLVKDCNSERVKCGNCVDVQNRLGLTLDVNHSVFSRDCPVYKRRIEARRKRIDYGNK